VGLDIMKSDLSDHPIVIKANPQRLMVRSRGRLVADTTRALTLFEASHPGVSYIPREDVDVSLLVPSPHTTRCPYKGQASYFSIATSDGVLENAGWTYERPFPVAAEIAGYLAFDRRFVD
jgi:uncharacterized protein (DUF427 family)